MLDKIWEHEWGITRVYKVNYLVIETLSSSLIYSIYEYHVFTLTLELKFITTVV